MDDDYYRLGLEWCVQEHDSIMKLCKKLTRRIGPQRQQCLEDAYHEALRVAGMCLRTYDGRVSIRTHVLGNMRWYIWKMLRKRMSIDNRGERRESNWTGEIIDTLRWTENKESALLARRRGYVSNNDELTSRDQVEYLMEQLPPAQAELLRWRFIEELSIKEIAELLDCACSTACSYVQDAIEAARGINCPDTRSSDL